MQQKKTTKINRTFDGTTLCVHVPSKPHPEGGVVIAHEDVRASEIAIASQILTLGLWTQEAYSFCCGVAGCDVRRTANAHGLSEDSDRCTKSDEEPVHDEHWMMLTKMVERMRKHTERLPPVDIVTS